MNELTVLYIIVVLWLAPWITALIFAIMLIISTNKKLKKLQGTVEKFIEENIEDEEERGE
jgi:hypothetical protein